MHIKCQALTCLMENDNHGLYIKRVNAFLSVWQDLLVYFLHKNTTATGTDDIAAGTSNAVMPYPFESLQNSYHLVRSNDTNDKY